MIKHYRKAYGAGFRAGATRKHTQAINPYQRGLCAVVWELAYTSALHKRLVNNLKKKGY